MKKIYLTPECDIMEVRMEETILAESYNYGGAGIYGEGSFVDNGVY